MPARTALVTGAGRGIGRAIAERLGDRGMTVAVHYASDDTAAKETVAAVVARGGRAFPVRAELGLPGDVDTLFAALTEGLREHTGDTGLDVLVNNAGIGCRGDVSQLTPEAFDRVIAVNVKAPVFIVQRALPLLRDGGRIVNVSSMATRVAHPEILGYAISKGALDMLAPNLARQLGPRGITVNTVSPGLIDTEFHGDRLRGRPEARAEAAAQPAVGRLGEPADVADVVAFLVSAEARWITGERLETSGGARL
ncbi:SDR family oxidoreductase [Micromonospora sp. WMMD882]|uniref:SDR family NAD(P)-dependent oxidoreductase n=1 Tax=Micromonospora sp. WMMD882 TaxID=3015151 RepID=UPI00248C9FAC|nr:SDR family oxidoreductase [Micromonospora sp. WMMD882]WBB81896.1 SDR family oxidoreductase [Micromonospora sp. WMMD882]